MTALALMVAVVVSGAPPNDTPKDEAFKQQMSEAIRRHDAGDFEGAISIYRSMLKTWPHEPTVVYELSFSMGANGATPKQMIEFLESELKVIKKPLPQMYSSLGSAYDGIGKLDLGEAALRKGRKLDPKSPDLAFNLGINLAMQKKMKEAEPEMRAAAELAPNWPSPWRTLAILMEDKGSRIDAVFARLNFLMLEPNTDRSRAAAKALDGLLDSMVKRGEKKVEVQMGANKDDFAGQLMLAAAFGDDKKSSSEQTVSGLMSLIDYALEEKPTGMRALLLKRLEAAKKAKCLEAALWEYRRSAGDPNADSWFGAHADEEERWETFITPQRRRGAP
ncbi:MAG: hypothetical protein QM817_22250 [Archangium sp.]